MPLRNLIELFSNELDDNELICSIADMMDWGEERVFNEACKQTNTNYHYNDYFKTVMSNKPRIFHNTFFISKFRMFLSIHQYSVKR